MAREVRGTEGACRALSRRSWVAWWLASMLGLFGAARAIAATTVPVRVRLLKAMRTGPASVDVKLIDLEPQLGKLAYKRWEAISEHHAEMEASKPASFDLPDGAVLELTLLADTKDSVTFEVKVTAHKMRSKLTISRDQRIVHQVSDDKDGVAYFCSVRPWP